MTWVRITHHPCLRGLCGVLLAPGGDGKPRLALLNSGLSTIPRITLDPDAHRWKPCEAPAVRRQRKSAANTAIGTGNRERSMRGNGTKAGKRRVGG